MNERMPKPSRELIQQARELRGHQTGAERRLWERLRRRQVEGVLFRRQHPFGHFIADFYCDEAHLVIEVDGSIHGERDQQERDTRRDKCMEDYNLAVLRFTNEEVFSNTERVVDIIREYVILRSGSISRRKVISDETDD